MNSSTDARLIQFKRTSTQLQFRFAAQNDVFNTSYQYERIDFLELENHYTPQVMRRVYALIAALEMTKFVNLECEKFHLGDLSTALPNGISKPWETLIDRIWAEWRYRNQRRAYVSPKLCCNGPEMDTTLALSGPGQHTLVFCGGGKDSLLTLRLLESAEMPFSTFCYSRSAYGNHEEQHKLTAQVVAVSDARQHHRLSISDDFREVCQRHLVGQTTAPTITEAETPISVAAALPYALAYHYTNLVVGHERSADSGNMIFEPSGREINHQWGKSLEAELVLNEVVSACIVAGIRYFSILKPIHDAVIYSMLRPYQDQLDLTHSCNVAKPWCGSCPKCCYVLTSFMGYLDSLPPGLETSTQQLIRSEQDSMLKALAGQADHLPFECIGEAGEMQLAIELCRRKGLSFTRHVGEQPTPPTLLALIKRYTAVDRRHHTMPPRFENALLPLLQAGAGDCERFLMQRLDLECWEDTIREVG